MSHVGCSSVSTRCFVLHLTSIFFFGLLDFLFSGEEIPRLFLVLRCGFGCQIKAQAAARVWAIGHFERKRGPNPPAA